MAASNWYSVSNIFITYHVDEEQLWWNIQFSSTFLGFFPVPERDLVIGTWCYKHGAIRRMPFNWCDGSCLVFEHGNCYISENRNNINNDEYKVTLKSSIFFIMIANRSILLNKKSASPPHPPPEKNQCYLLAFTLSPWTTIPWVWWGQRYGVPYFEDAVQKTHVNENEFSSSWSSQLLTPLK